MDQHAHDDQRLSQDDAPMVFSQDDEADYEETNPWTILIVDDEPEMHQVTLMALRDFSFQQRKLNFISAYSAAEAKSLLQQDNEIALILLDVVMETDDAGLTLVKYIRDTLQNHLARIILRTGQPGQAPEQRVIKDYDINDYRSKTELTVQRLTTTVVSALRSFTTIQQLEQLNHSLEAKVAERTQALEAANQQLKKTVTELEAGERAGKQVQFKLLPSQVFTHGDYQLSHALQPSDFMSGDFVDYFALDQDKIVFYIADVSGHGVASAFVTVYLKRFIGALLERYQRGDSTILANPAALLDALNSELLRENITKYIALFYGVLDTSKQQITYANAGAYPWPLLCQHQQPAEFLELKSTPVGMFDFSNYQNQTLALTENSALFIFSDGILDVLPEQTSAEKLKRLQQSCSAHISIAELMHSLRIEPAQSLPDDMTILKLDYRSTA
ncbi:SpoIIE family protein phosphatase [Alkalimonas collagenimarina]|uniref:SpoIIE family protein phosphatase n=1 Tax=Alkalimonas collagenimarina TaxID=400390 RepID=A0ABT9GYF7_9GAMM|nr:SpoIIE family protein phosphatase [Alkalimonas collagenimarina]MDP4535899.1 SpoIIE family protein phosphatase [Alkalimonas collagenimarina]